MAISQADLAFLQSRINAKLSVHKAQFIVTTHFSADRVNDLRNVPPITLPELESIFNRLIARHLIGILALNHGDTFNIKCTTSHINIPCAVEKNSSAQARSTSFPKTR
jgi:hypothetical protein